jgi:hypothetical protein
MTQDEMLSFEAIDRHISAADLRAMSPGGKFHMTTAQISADPAAALPNICGAYKIVRPILNALQVIPFLKQSWKDAIKGFVGVMDAICP